MPKIIDGLFKFKKINDFIIAKETIDIDNNNLKYYLFLKEMMVFLLKLNSEPQNI